MSYKASAPGSLMLLGEYGVLQGGHALVCAVDKRITVTLTPRTDKKIEIHSRLHGNYSTTLNHLTIEKPFQFVLGALYQYRTRLRQGCTLTIESEFSDKVGFGSSAAVTVATVATIMAWLKCNTSPLDIVKNARKVIRQVQGLGSGADVAASTLGGIVAYRAQPLSAEKYPVLYPLTALYAGFKTPTVDAIKHVQDYFNAHPQLLKTLHESIGHCAIEGMQMVRKEDWVGLGKVMNIQQGMMEALGVSTILLQDMIRDLRKSPTILGAKISGSGLGDCVIGLGELASPYVASGQHEGIQPIPVAMSEQGVHCEEV